MPAARVTIIVRFWNHARQPLDELADERETIAHRKILHRAHDGLDGRFEKHRKINL